MGPLKNRVSKEKQKKKVLENRIRFKTYFASFKGIIQYANEAVKKLAGYRPTALIGKNVKILMVNIFRFFVFS